MRLIRALESDIPSIWGRVLPYLEKALEIDKKTFKTEDIFKFLVEGKQQLWLVLDDLKLKCIVITEIIQYPRITSLRIEYIGGEDRETWTYLFDELEKEASGQGCDRIEAIARPGWRRELKDLGFEQRLFVTREIRDV